MAFGILLRVQIRTGSAPLVEDTRSRVVATTRSSATQTAPFQQLLWANATGAGAANAMAFGIPLRVRIRTGCAQRVVDTLSPVAATTRSSGTLTATWVIKPTYLRMFLEESPMVLRL